MLDYVNTFYIFVNDGEHTKPTNYAQGDRYRGGEVEGSEAQGEELAQQRLTIHQDLDKARDAGEPQEGNKPT